MLSSRESPYVVGLFGSWSAWSAAPLPADDAVQGPLDPVTQCGAVAIALTDPALEAVITGGERQMHEQSWLRIAAVRSHSVSDDLDDVIAVDRRDHGDLVE